MNTIKRAHAEVEIVEEISDLKIIHQKAFPDERGFFCEAYNIDEWANLLDFKIVFRQDNHSHSHYGVLRGLHSQVGMGKLVTVISGRIFDVAVDIRLESATFGQHFGVIIDDDDLKHFWIPAGFLHGFLVLSEEGAHVMYKCSTTYDAKSEFGVNPFDADIGIKWPISDKNDIIISDRDRAHPDFVTVFGKKPQ